jgi:hypothetical protein
LPICCPEGMETFGSFAALAIVAGSLTGSVFAQERVIGKTMAPRPENVSTVDGMSKAWCEIISGPAGQPGDWARDRTLYIPELRFVHVDLDKQGRPQPKIFDHQQYVDRADAGMQTQP